MSGDAVSPADSPLDVRPIVGVDRGNRPLWIGIAAILLVGALLFVALESRRQTALAPAVRPRASDLAQGAAPAVPPLYVPPVPTSLEAQRQPDAPPAPAILRPAIQAEQRPASIVPQGPPPSAPPPRGLTPTEPAPPREVGPAIVFDATEAAATGTPGASGGGEGAAIAKRARATRVAANAFLVPQGTLIPAVLETALDSTQPGQARALVSRNVVNLRGERILIPRGSRLYGSYRGDLGAGQSRAQVEWTRLVRPDGVTIAIDSPAADRLGRAGIKGRVNTHFLERFGGALLQSSIDVGATMATRSIGGDTVVVALPGNVSSAASGLIGPAPKPTLKVRQGKRISVFVARDLDFSSVERDR